LTAKVPKKWIGAKKSFYQFGSCGDTGVEAPHQLLQKIGLGFSFEWGVKNVMQRASTGLKRPLGPSPAQHPKRYITTNGTNRGKREVKGLSTGVI